MPKSTSILAELTDEEILDEFVKRFQCDGAILIYLESNTEYGFAKWTNPNGRKWVNELFTSAQNHISIPNSIQDVYNFEERLEVIM